MKIIAVKGTTSKLVSVFIQDSSSTVGAGLTGLAFNTPSLKAYYYREGANASAVISLATMTLGTWATGGFVVVDGTNMPGVYSLAIPDAALASGANSVLIMLSGAANMVPTLLEVQLTNLDPNDGVHLGLTALPNAVAGAANGLIINGTNSGGVTIQNSGGNALTLQSTGGNGHGLAATGNGSGDGFHPTGGATGNGMQSQGGVTSGKGLLVSATTGDDAVRFVGAGAGDGFKIIAGGTGNGMEIIGGGTSGDGFVATVTSGVTFNVGLRVQKNLALSNFVFYLTSSSDHVTPATGITVAPTRSLDGAAFGACANPVSEIGNGYYKINLAATDLNAKVVALSFTGVGADGRALTILTQT